MISFLDPGELTMQTSPVRLIEYFDGTKQSVIPLFQRPYSWNTDRCSVLWGDLMALYVLDSPPSHFMGAVVSLPATTIPVGVNKHLIIDGQQRLMTTALLLCVLRNHVDERNAGRIEDFL